MAVPNEPSLPAPVSMAAGQLAPGSAGAVQLTAHRRPLKALTGIRFFAAMFVVTFHSRVGALLAEHGHAWASHFFFNGFLAVPLFFLLSGFILAYTYEGQIEKPGDHRRFWEARFARIWPVYALSLFATSIPSGHHPQPVAAVGTLMMVQAWNPFNANIAGAWNPVCWSLSVEALFYVCFPFVQVWFERRGTRAQLVWIGLMMVLCVGLDTGARTLGYAPERMIQVPLPVWHLPEFFAGVGLGNYFLRRLAVQTMRSASGSKTPALLPGRGLWTYGSLLVAVALLCRPQDRWLSLVIPAFCALVFSLAAERTLVSRVLSTPLVMLGGGISYSIYLFQFPVRQWVQAVANLIGVHSETLRSAVTVLVLLLLSLMLFKGVEDPARRVIRRFFAALEARRGTHTASARLQGSIR